MKKSLGTDNRKNKWMLKSKRKSGGTRKLKNER